MAILVSFEGGIGVGKTTLVNYFSNDLGAKKLLEKSEMNPFLVDFYAGSDVKLETEITFLLQHYSQLKSIKGLNGLVLADFSVEKDLIFARMNLTRNQYHVFRSIYDYISAEVGFPNLVIYLDVSFETISKRIMQRGRAYEAKADLAYFESYADRLKQYYTRQSGKRLLFVDANALEINPSNPKIRQIRSRITSVL